MQILQLSLNQFRNLEPLLLEPSPGFNVLFGNNAQGKTNLLEGIYVLARLKSFRSARLQEMVAFNSQAAVIKARIQNRRMVENVEVQLAPGSRKAMLDGKSAPSMGSYLSRFRVVVFTPEEIYLGRNAPEGRRRFLDRAVFNLDGGHLDDVRKFEQALKRRNALLKVDSPRFLERDAISAYDGPLALYGSRIVRRRMARALSVERVFKHIWARVSGGGGVEVGLSYQSAVAQLCAERIHGDGGMGGGRSERWGAESVQVLPGSGYHDVFRGLGGADGPVREELAAAYVRALGEGLESHWRRGSTGLGPHLDDLELSINGRPLGQFGSQGQQRMFVLALKIAEAELVRGGWDDPPLFLLDDISSELDEEKNRLLFNYLEGVQGQVFVTTTDRSLVGIGKGVDCDLFTGAGGEEILADLAGGLRRNDYKIERGRVWKVS